MTTKRGILTVKQSKNKTSMRVCLGQNVFSPARDQISQSIIDQAAEMHGCEVEFDLVDGQPKKVREVGKPFATPSCTPGRKGPKGGGSRSARPSRHRGRGPSGSRSQGQKDGDFHNPYNFVPAPPRTTEDPDLGDHCPVPHDTLDPDRYTGQIGVRMIVKTPLLLPDTVNAREDNGHKIYPLRVDADGRPLIAASSVRGMLRSAYEAVTNSRFGCFCGSNTKHLQKGDAPPSDLLPESVKPAGRFDELSPADRVFGWVRPGTTREHNKLRNGPTAVRGQLRVGAVRCLSHESEAKRRFDEPGLPLSILSTPKPQQARFYVAKCNKGEAQERGLSKRAAGYRKGKGLRGRKFYPHHRNLPDDYWSQPLQHREYTRAHMQDKQQQRSDQNYSILEWVQPGTEFTFNLHIQNLSAVELGALIWILDLPDGHYLRLGGGKPLGFGSVSLNIDNFAVRRGEGIRARYSGWDIESSAGDVPGEAVKRFQDAVCRAYSTGGQGFNEVPFIAAFLVACKGFDDDLPIHYPRTLHDGPGDESFKWFVANEREGARYTLPDLVSDTGLPLLPDAKKR